MMLSIRRRRRGHLVRDNSQALSPAQGIRARRCCGNRHSVDRGRSRCHGWNLLKFSDPILRRKRSSRWVCQTSWTAPYHIFERRIHTCEIAIATRRIPLRAHATSSNSMLRVGRLLKQEIVNLLITRGSINMRTSAGPDRMGCSSAMSSNSVFPTLAPRSKAGERSSARMNHRSSARCSERISDDRGGVNSTGQPGKHCHVNIPRRTFTLAADGVKVTLDQDASHLSSSIVTRHGRTIRQFTRLGGALSTLTVPYHLICKSSR